MFDWSLHGHLCFVFALFIRPILAQGRPGGPEIFGQSDQPFSNLQKVGCQVANLYQNPNASATYPIPAIDAVAVPGPEGKPNVTLKQSPDTKWKFTNVLGRSTDVYAPDSHPVLQQAMYLDTSASFTDGTPMLVDAGLTGCSFFFNLPLSDLGKKDNGSCYSIFDEKCINDFVRQANSAAYKASANMSSGISAWMDSCKGIADAMGNLPPSCIKFKEKGSKSLGRGIFAFSPLDLRPPLPRQAYICNDTKYPLQDGPFPTNVFVQSASWPNLTDYKVYDQWALAITPVLLTYFTNTTTPLVNSQPFSASSLICSTPSNVQPGSRGAPAPTFSNAADTGVGKLDATQLVLGALAINAVIFWML